jgi:hypothetical protein
MEQILFKIIWKEENNQLTPWSKILVKQLVAQSVRKYPHLLWNPKVHYFLRAC